MGEHPQHDIHHIHRRATCRRHNRRSTVHTLLRRREKIEIDYNDANFKTIYRDEYTGEIIPYSLVKQAMAEEMSYFNSTVWQAVDHQAAKGKADFKLIRTRWVVCNKGDTHHPDVRARLVACEINDQKSDAFFAGTPPLEAKKLLCSQFGSRRWLASGKPLALSVVDIKRHMLMLYP